MNTARVHRVADHYHPVLCCRMVASLRALHPPNAAMVRPFAVSFLQRPQWEAFRFALRCLRRDCPTADSVVVRTSTLTSDVLGECVRRKNRFVIRLNRRMGEEQATETLLHEWAHALAWNFSLDSLAKSPNVDRELFDYVSHDEAWGCAYSRVWRAYSAAARQ